ncbi:hypothetical protein [Nocardia brasiliensis]|uniref:hypothetical protein n=1 Tax=Nocardia brasiliensis TaxID=37326 RepID=UPI0018955C1C|nr:hypothetical protein [Nocardia brasiliensis]MBF6124715.1 hypothetical protein [Nocardia brasiliensis]
MTAPVADDVVREVVRDAIRSVWKNCPDLIENGAHARTVVAHIAAALNLRLETWAGLWRADVDYNLFHERGLQVIRERYLRAPEACADDVYPNLIVHDPRGGGPDHRLLVLEAEKSCAATPHRESAYRKLQGFLEHFDYHQAVYLEYDARPRLEWLVPFISHPDPTRPPSEEL